MNAIYKTVLLFIGIAILVKQGAFEDIQAFVASQPSVSTDPTVQEERKPEEVNNRTPVVTPSPVNNPVAVAPTPITDESFPEDARKTIYCVKALQMREGLVPVGAVLKVQTEFADYYVVRWRGYVFRVSKDSVTDNREDGSRAVGEEIQKKSERVASNPRNKTKETYRPVDQQSIEEIKAGYERKEKNRIYAARIQQLQSEANAYGTGSKHVVKNGVMVPANYATARKEAIISEVNFLRKQQALDNGQVGWQPRITPSTGFHRGGTPIEE